MYEVKDSNHLNAVFNATLCEGNHINFVSSVACEAGSSPKMLKYDFKKKKLEVIDLLKKAKKEESGELDLSSVEH